MLNNLVKIVVFVPEDHADSIREILANAGAGQMGNYSHCSFSVKGTGRFKPLERSRPAIGEVGKVEEVIEERIEVICEKDKLKKVLQAIKQAHPYEEPATEVYPLLDV